MIITSLSQFPLKNRKTMFYYKALPKDVNRILFLSEKCVTKVQVITSLVFLVYLNHKVPTIPTRLKQLFFPQQAVLGRCNILPAQAALDEVSCLFLAVHPRGCRSDVMQEDVDLNECLWHCLSIAYFPGMLH